jgi:hypothetical protein
MIVNIGIRSRAAELDLPEWSAAEVLDAPLPNDLMLRAIVCRAEAGKWQWSVSSLEGDRGELISTGLAESAAAARLMATSEIAKCVENPIESSYPLHLV